MPKLGLGLSLPQTRKVGGGGVPFSPIDISNLSLWLKADAGVTTTASSYNYKSNIALSSAGQTTINGNYTPSQVPDKNSNYILFGPNNNQIDVRPNLSPVYRLYNTDNYIDGEPQYYDFTSTNGTTWSFGNGKRPVSITISGLTGASAVANGAYGPFEWTVDDPNIFWSASNSTALGFLKVYTNGSCELYADIGGFFLIATGSNWGIGSFTPVLPGTGSPTGSGTIYPTGGVPTGVVTTTTVNLSNVRFWADQSGNGNNTDDYEGYSPLFVSNVKNGKPVIRFGFGGDTTVLKTLDTNLIGNSGDFTIIAVYNYIHSGNEWAGVFSKGDFASAGGSQIDFEAYFINGDNDWRNVMGVMDSDVLDWVWSSSDILHSNEWIIHEGISDVTNNSQKMFINTSEVSSSNSVSTINALDIKIGIGNAGADSEPLPPNFGGFQGDIAEIIVYDKALTTPERQQVEAYLNTKYAIY